MVTDVDSVAVDWDVPTDVEPTEFTVAFKSESSSVWAEVDVRMKIFFNTHFLNRMIICYTLTFFLSGSKPSSNDQRPEGGHHIRVQGCPQK